MGSGLGSLLDVGRTAVRDLGFRRAMGVLARKLWRKARRDRPPNTVEGNLEVWETHDWSQCGEEWTVSPAWKEAILDELLRAYMPAGGRILEIGPGAGRWTEHLIPIASRLILVDLTPACIALCRKRFASERGIEYHVNDGRSVPFLSDESVDGVWSFDTFVHIEPSEVRTYMAEFARVMAPGAVGVTHRARAGRHRRSWRSDMTAERMADFCLERHLELVKQQESLRDGSISLCRLETHFRADVVSVFRKPA
ncbi:MAG: class I SAM-dependent methyltransferase [Armatimonadetes bacterium]|nr:class I SAM-dependent methyltransferase [Armatimonadota bacterium]